MLVAKPYFLCLYEDFDYIFRFLWYIASEFFQYLFFFFRHKLREACEKLMFSYPLEYGRKAEELMWKKVCYDVIHAVKAGRKVRNEVYCHY